MQRRFSNETVEVIMLVDFLGFAGLTLATSVVLGAVVGTNKREELKPGDVAPDFRMVGSDGKTYRLKDLLQQRPVVLAWFPKAFTGG